MDQSIKKLIQVFKDNGFSIDIVTNVVKVDFLDITFNLNNGSYQTYKKLNDELSTSMSFTTNHQRLQSK